MSTTSSIRPIGPYSLAASARFLTGWGPAANSVAAPGGQLHLAFVPQGEEDAAGVCLREGDGTVEAEVFGAADRDTVRDELARILSLDVDGTGYAEVGRRDPVIGRLQEGYPGLRPVLFFSPWEAAVWAILSQRVQMGQAVKAKERIARDLGEAVEVHGDRLHAFPSPARLLDAPPIAGLFGRKAEYLHRLAEAALGGRLDADRLRSLPPDAALEELKGLPGVGDFSARLILIRGVGLVDSPPARERRFLQAFALAYGLRGEPSDERIARTSEAWRPYRTWVTVLLRVMLDDTAT